MGVIANTSTKKPLKLSEISKLPEERLDKIINIIPHIGAAKSVLITAGLLNKYLNETAPGYFEKEVQYNKEKLRTKISSQVPYLIKGFNQVNQLNHIHQGRF